MVRQSSVVVGYLLAGSLLAAEAYPLDVAKYIERREVCEHFRQEPWPEGTSLDEKERRKFLAAQLDRYCTNSDRLLRELKGRYKDNQSVLNRLKEYEATIEAEQ